MSWIKYGLLISITTILTIVCIFIADIFAKTALDLGEPIVYDAHPLWGYSPRENRTYSRFDGNIVTINEVGARGGQPWSSSGNNIVFLGDSITYGGRYGGSQIDDNQTFASLTCNELQNWTCHNAGVNSYGILNMVARSRYDARISSAPVRVFTFITRDFDRGLRNSNHAHFILREPPSYLSALWEVLNYLSARIKHKTKNWFGKNSDIDDPERISREMHLNRRFALDIFLMELDRLNDQGLEFLLVHSPSVTELQNNELIENNEILSVLEQKYPNRFLYLTEPLGSAYTENKRRGEERRGEERRGEERRGEERRGEERRGEERRGEERRGEERRGEERRGEERRGEERRGEERRGEERRGEDLL